MKKARLYSFQEKGEQQIGTGYLYQQKTLTLISKYYLRHLIVKLMLS